jgi:hypothetical protein
VIRQESSCRRDLLDHVIILNEGHLKRLMSSYLLLLMVQPAESRKGLNLSLCGGSLDSRAIFLKTKLFFLKPCRGTVDILRKHLSPGDESACHPNPESLRQVERNPFNAGATIWRTTAAHQTIQGGG